MARAKRTDAQPASLEGPEATGESRRSREGRELLQGFAKFCLGSFVFWIVISVPAFQAKPGATNAPATVTATDVSAKALTAYVTDFAGAIARATTERLNAELEQFEKETSNQVAVAIYAQLPDIPLEEFSIKVAEVSRLGSRSLDNGVILSVFAKDKVARIEVGYGLEGTLTDLQTHRILESVLAPAWSLGDHDKAIEDTLTVMTSVIRDDYRAGRVPGVVTIFWRRLSSALPTIAKGIPAELASMSPGVRLGLALFGTFILGGFWDGLLQARHLVRNAIISINNLRAGRTWSFGTRTAEIGSAIDSMNLLIFVGFWIAVAAGVVVIAGGGGFGGAGSTLRW